MTDYNTLVAMLHRAGISFDEGSPYPNCITLEGNTHVGVGGYTGFQTVWIFDKNDNLVEVENWE